MRSGEIQKQLDALALEEQQLVAQAESIIEAARTEMVEPARAWIDETVARAITDHAPKVQALGIERLRELKSGVADLKARIPEIVREQTANEKHWPHTRDPDSTDQYQLKRSDYLADVFRKVVSEVGAILDNFGLLEARPGYEPNWARVGVNYRYQYSVGYGDTKGGLADQYSVTKQQLDKLRIDMSRKRQALEEAKAKELWESA